MPSSAARRAAVSATSRSISIRARSLIAAFLRKEHSTRAATEPSHHHRCGATLWHHSPDIGGGIVYFCSQMFCGHTAQDITGAPPVLIIAHLAEVIRRLYGTHQGCGGNLAARDRTGARLSMPEAGRAGEA